MLELKSDLSYAVLFRHLPRAKAPPKGDLVDFEMGLHQNSPLIAKGIIDVHFGNLEPVRLCSSQVPRAKQTLGFLWPSRIQEVEVNDRLGPTRETLAEWSSVQALPYTATPREIFEADHALVTRIGIACLSAVQEGMFTVRRGQFAAFCSHTPHVDTACRLVRSALGISQNDSWLPEGFNAGDFALIGFQSDGRFATFGHFPAPAL